MKTFLLKSLALFTLTLFVFSCEKEEVSNLNCLSPGQQNGLIAFYPFNSGSLLDESQNGNDLYNTTGASSTTDRSGNTNCAFEFDNGSTAEEYLERPNASFLNDLNSFSLALWYCPLDTSRYAGNYESLVSRGDQWRCSDKNGEWSLGLYDCRKAVFGHANSVWANSGNKSCGDAIINFTDQWQHVVAVKDQTTFSIYYNGVLHERETGADECTNSNQSQDLHTFFLGKAYTGKIDDVLLYDRAISAQEITDLQTLGACCK